MGDRLSSFLKQQHAEAEEALERCVRADGQVDLARFDRFRRALLHHIAVEERVLRPALLAAGCSPVFQNELRQDHAGIAALCIPLPCVDWVRDLRELLEHHHHVEEAADGFYARVDALVTDDRLVLAQIASLPSIHLPMFESGPRVRDQLRAVLIETGITHAPGAAS